MGAALRGDAGEGLMSHVATDLQVLRKRVSTGEIVLGPGASIIPGKSGSGQIRGAFSFGAARPSPTRRSETSTGGFDFGQFGLQPFRAQSFRPESIAETLALLPLSEEEQAGRAFIGRQFDPESFFSQIVEGRTQPLFEEQVVRPALRQLRMQEETIPSLFAGGPRGAIGRQFSGAPAAATLRLRENVLDSIREARFQEFQASRQAALQGLAITPSLIGAVSDLPRQQVAASIALQRFSAEQGFRVDEARSLLGIAGLGIEAELGRERIAVSREQLAQNQKQFDATLAAQERAQKKASKSSIVPAVIAAASFFFPPVAALALPARLAAASAAGQIAGSLTGAPGAAPVSQTLGTLSAISGVSPDFFKAPLSETDAIRASIQQAFQRFPQSQFSIEADVDLMDIFEQDAIRRSLFPRIPGVPF